MTISPGLTSEQQFNPPEATSSRIESIDLLRGLVMIVMVLDHVRDFFGDAKLDPTDLTTTSPALFFTRWATHFCAPTFIFLAGVSASISGVRRTRGELSWHLFTRGLWLIFLEQTWGNVFLFFTYPQVVLGLVLWAIGWSMIALAGLIYLPRVVIGGIGIAMIGGHNLFDRVQVSAGFPDLLWGLLHSPGLRFLPGGIPILVGYTLIPWIGVMAAGYALGPVFVLPSGRRRPILFALGLGMLAGFFVLRYLNIYGDPRPWKVQPNFVVTMMSFLNCQKYPPSLLYLLMTLGPALLALVAFDHGMGRLRHPLRTFGQVPLFFYLLQWPLAHGLAVILAAIQGYPIGWMFRFPPFQSPSGYGNSLPTIYLFWAITVAILYYPSRLFGEWKRRLRASSLPAIKSKPSNLIDDWNSVAE